MLARTQTRRRSHSRNPAGRGGRRGSTSRTHDLPGISCAAWESRYAVAVGEMPLDRVVRELRAHAAAEDRFELSEPADADTRSGTPNGGPIARAGGVPPPRRLDEQQIGHAHLVEAAGGEWAPLNIDARQQVGPAPVASLDRRRRTARRATAATPAPGAAGRPGGPGRRDRTRPGRPARGRGGPCSRAGWPGRRGPRGGRRRRHTTPGRRRPRGRAASRARTRPRRRGCAWTRCRSPRPAAIRRARTACSSALSTTTRWSIGRVCRTPRPARPSAAPRRLCVTTTATTRASSAAPGPRLSLHA